MRALAVFLSLNKATKDRNHKLIQFFETSSDDALKRLPLHIEAMEISDI